MEKSKSMSMMFKGDYVPFWVFLDPYNALFIALL